jgi:hypothetical protein
MEGSVADEPLPERGYSLLLIFKYLEQIQQGNHLQRLDRKFGRVKQLDRSAPLLRGSQNLDQQADPAGIDPGNFTQLQHNARIAVAHQIVQSLSKAVDRVTQIQPAA